MFANARLLLSQTLTASLFGAILLIPVAVFVLSGERGETARLASTNACEFSAGGCQGASHWRESRFPIR